MIPFLGKLKHKIGLTCVILILFLGAISLDKYLQIQRFNWHDLSDLVLLTLYILIQIAPAVLRKKDAIVFLVIFELWVK